MLGSIIKPLKRALCWIPASCSGMRKRRHRAKMSQMSCPTLFMPIRTRDKIQPPQQFCNYPACLLQATPGAELSPLHPCNALGNFIVNRRLLPGERLNGNVEQRKSALHLGCGAYYLAEFESCAGDPSITAERMSIDDGNTTIVRVPNPRHGRNLGEPFVEHTFPCRSLSLPAQL